MVDGGEDVVEFDDVFVVGDCVVDLGYDFVGCVFVECGEVCFGDLEVCEMDQLIFYGNGGVGFDVDCVYFGFVGFVGCECDCGVCDEVGLVCLVCDLGLVYEDVFII